MACVEFDDRPRPIEVKTTNKSKRTPFPISRNELAVSEEHRHDWCHVRVWDFARNPRRFELRPPLDAHASLMPASFQVSFRSGTDAPGRQRQGA
ncbi:DUF3883 domain-containing protein [Sphingomonas jinjuensis]|uniref:DUF3883 domain-containing protein n=1 Tax=Sphingomonas jinjuensis TaxID=535907 RepID=UPI003CCCC624